MKKLERLVYLSVFEINYREVKHGDTLVVKSLKNNKCEYVVTINKGKKEFLFPVDKINVLRLLNGRELSKSDLFVNDEDYTIYTYDGAKRIKKSEVEILEQLTELGRQLYLIGEYGIEVLETYKSFLS